MSARSNFLEVTLSQDGESLTVHGTTDGTLTDIFASVVERPDGDEPVAKRKEITGRFVGNVVLSDWDVEIENVREDEDDAPFDVGDRVLVAGAALHEDGDHDVWVDSLKIAAPSED